MAMFGCRYIYKVQQLDTHPSTIRNLKNHADKNAITSIIANDDDENGKYIILNSSVNIKNKRCSILKPCLVKLMLATYIFVEIIRVMQFISQQKETPFNNPIFSIK